MAALQFRSFLNADPPVLAGLWSRQSPMQGREPTLSPALWELEVFSKPYFDREGLILAMRDEATIGFVHAGFAPNAALDALDRSAGVISWLGLPDAPDASAARGLLDEAERYLRRNGAETIAAGARHGAAPFYGGACSGIANGVCDLDLLQSEAFARAGFQRTNNGRLWRCDIRQFRPPVNRDMLAIKRGFEVAWQDDAAPSNWWQSCQYATHSLSRYELRDKRDRSVVAEATFCDLAPLMTSWAARTLSLAALWHAPEASPEAAAFLVGEALRRSAAAGFAALLACSSLASDLVDAVATQLRFETVAPFSTFTK